jgi:hypothetical protein
MRAHERHRPLPRKEVTIIASYSLRARLRYDASFRADSLNESLFWFVDTFARMGTSVLKRRLTDESAYSLVAASPVLAQDKMEKMGKMDKMECTDAEMMKMNGKIDAMSVGSNKTMAMHHMKMAKDSMSKSDMSGCSMHMNEAMSAMEKK